MRKDRVIAEVLGEENTLTPSDLYNAEFRTVLVGGYDKEEVDFLLERAADVLEALINQAHALKEQNSELREQLDKFHEMESTLHAALVSSQKFSESALESAKREAAAIRAEAEVVRDRARLEAEELPDALREEIHALKAERGRFRMEMKALLETHHTLIEQIPPAEEHEAGVFSGKTFTIGGPDGPLELDHHYDPALDEKAGKEKDAFSLSWDDDKDERE